jgi:hypothetical protein
MVLKIAEFEAIAGNQAERLPQAFQESSTLAESAKIMSETAREFLELLECCNPGLVEECMEILTREVSEYADWTARQNCVLTKIPLCMN